jgi:hypothetical protein
VCDGASGLGEGEGDGDGDGVDDDACVYACAGWDVALTTQVLCVTRCSAPTDAQCGTACVGDVGYAALTVDCFDDMSLTTGVAKMMCFANAVSGVGGGSDAGGGVGGGSSAGLTAAAGARLWCATRCTARDAACAAACVSAAYIDTVAFELEGNAANAASGDGNLISAAGRGAGSSLTTALAVAIVVAIATQVAQ